MAYQRRILATGTVFNQEENGFWTFADLDGDGSQDLVYIKTRNTDTGKIEVHGSRNESRFQEHSLATGTAFDIEDNGTWIMQDWTGDGKADLVYIKTRNTGTHSVEVYVADAASGYQNVVLHSGTCFAQEDNGIWTMSDRGDLVYIKTRNCGSGNIEYQVASKVSNYQDITQHAVTNFSMEDNNGTWCIAPKNSSHLVVLYYIQTRNTRSGKVEVHGRGQSFGWQTHPVDVVTSFGNEENGQWMMVHFSHQVRPDLVYIKTNNCESGKVEVHINEPERVYPQPFMDSCRNLRLDGDDSSVLRADLKRNDGSWRDAFVDLNIFLGNTDGKFASNKKAFRDSARRIRLTGSVISAELQKDNDTWSSDSFDLRARLLNNNGVFQAIEVPIILAIPKEQENVVLKQLDEALIDPAFKFQAVQEKDGVTIFYGNASISSEGTFFKTCTAEAKASVMHLVQSKGRPIEQVNVDVFTARASATVGSYIGADAGVSLIKAEGSIFDLNLGIGVDTGAGIKDESLDIHALGCGFQVGRKVSISVFGNSFGLDFGRLVG